MDTYKSNIQIGRNEMVLLSKAECQSLRFCVPEGVILDKRGIMRDSSNLISCVVLSAEDIEKVNDHILQTRGIENYINK